MIHFVLEKLCSRLATVPRAICLTLNHPHLHVVFTVPEHILITGASSGLGAALAVHYAAAGVMLSLTGRDTARLVETAEACRAEGANVEAATLDVTDREGMQRWLLAREAARPIDLVIANAGISGGSGGDGTLFGESAAQTEAIFATNVGGVLNTLLPLLPALRARRSGQIAIISSLASFRGLPGAPAYSASKMAVRGWGEALRGALAADGIRVSVVCPGYVVTRMTASNRFPMPGLMEAPKAAAIIARGLARNRARIAFPGWFAFATWLLGSLPPMLTDGIYARLPKK